MRAGPLMSRRMGLPPLPESVLAAELADDLSASGDAAPGMAPSWLARPSVLRRIASAAARLIDPGADRIAVTGPGAMALGAAVSMTSGLPFCVLDDGGIELGAVYPGEDVVLITVDGAAGSAVRTLASRVARLSRIIAVAVPAGQHPAADSTVLFTVKDGRYVPVTGKGNHRG